MWFATREGLDRYDSYQIKNYYIKDSLPGVSPDKIAAILCKKDSIYIATEDGLYIYDQQTDQIARSQALLERVSVLCLFKSAANVYVGTTNGLFRLTGNTSSLVTPKNSPVRAMEQVGPDRFLISIGNKLEIIDKEGKV